MNFGVSEHSSSLFSLEMTRNGKAAHSTSETQKYKKAKWGILSMAGQVIPSQATVNAWQDETDSFSWVDLHIPMSKWCFLAFCSFINVLQNIAIQVLDTVANGYWTLLIKHTVDSTISKNNFFKKDKHHFVWKFYLENKKREMMIHAHKTTNFWGSN